MTLSRQSLFDCQKLISETLNLVHLVFWNMPKIVYLHIDTTYSHTALVSANIQHFTRNDSENKSDIPEHRQLLWEGANLTVISRSRRCCEAFDCCLIFN